MNDPIQKEILFLPIRIYQTKKVVQREAGFHLNDIEIITEGTRTPYKIILVNESGIGLESRSLVITDTHRSMDDEYIDFLVTIPWNSDCRSILIKYKDETIHTIEIEKEFPKIINLQINQEVGSEVMNVRWEVGNKDTSIRYILRYTHNNGKTWKALVTYPSSTEKSVNIDEIPGGEKCYFEIFASMGIRTSSMRSEIFSIKQKPVEISIILPKDGHHYFKDEPISLFATAFSLEKGSVDSKKIVWSSDISGFLGKSFQLSIPTLSPGKHLIRAELEDVKTIFQTIRITVDQLNRPSIM